ncbi:MAG: 2OG-Fe(II) oxygenase [Alphaproteobacteria bacterium]
MQAGATGVDAAAALAERIGALDWPALSADLDAWGHAVAGPLLDPGQCAALRGLYDAAAPFRSRVTMARHGFGQGEYKYFADPLPPVVAALRDALYPPLAAVANGWAARLGAARRYPPDLDSFRAECHAAGQTRPTPLLLRYGPGDYNCLHRDLYGDIHFPLQAAILLDAPGRDFAGGEFVLVEQRPRMQSRAAVVPLGQGQAVLFAVDARPRRGVRGDHRVTLRHGVSRVRAGRRHVLGIIFHDAR